jgi:S-sulfo-L-cysteine synthase (3-phospho-L-serine-dependent)
MPKQVLILSGMDYGPVAYQGLEQSKREGCRLTLLSDGSFIPRPGLYDQVLVHDLKKTLATLEFMKKHLVRFDAVVTLSSDWLTTLVALLAQHYGCRGNTPSTAFRCRSKYHTRRTLREAGVPSPDFRLCHSFKDILQAVSEIGTPCVAKPIGGHASIGVFMIEDSSHLDRLKTNYERSIRYALQHDDEVFFDFSPEEYSLFGLTPEVNMQTDYLVEEYLDGHEISVDALVQNGEATLLGIEDQIRMKSPYFLQIAARLPYLCAPKEKRAIRDLVAQTVHAMGIRDSATHTEIMFTSKGPKIVEIGCRAGGDDLQDTLFRVTGYNVMHEIIQIALGTPRRYEVRTHCHTAMRFFLPEKKGVLKKIEVSPGLRDSPFVNELAIQCHPGDRVAPPPDGFEYLGYVSVQGKTPEEAWRHLQKANRSVRFSIDPSP